MRALAAAGAGFLLAVLWFDLMFDTQSRGHHDSELPDDVRASIAAYYRRVTTTAYPMNRLVAAAMVATIGGIAAQLVAGNGSPTVDYISLALTVVGVGLALVRTVPNAKRLGNVRSDSPAQQSRLARAIYHDHLVSLACIASVLVLQVAVA